nr:hypothetical protein CFP56_01781 [Quercus suber]
MSRSFGVIFTIDNDLRQNGFAIEARVDNVWSHFGQFGHVLDVYLSKVKVMPLVEVLVMVAETQLLALVPAQIQMM